MNRNDILPVGPVSLTSPYELLDSFFDRVLVTLNTLHLLFTMLSVSCRTYIFSCHTQNDCHRRNRSVQTHSCPSAMSRSSRNRASYSLSRLRTLIGIVPQHHRGPHVAIHTGSAGSQPIPRCSAPDQSVFGTELRRLHRRSNYWVLGIITASSG